MRSKTTDLLTILILCLAFAATAKTQTTEFTYQGSLSDGGAAASGSHDFEFLLFDSLVSGTQIGSTVTRNAVAVSNGIFVVRLDFGSQFPGANRFLEIRVRVSGQGGITILAPRQQIGSEPYAIKSLNAENAAIAATANNALSLGGTAANQFVLTGDARLSDARNPLPNSSNYIQNQNAGAQASSDFNISGTGTANIFNASARFDLGGNHILSSPGSNNLFAGLQTGQATTTGVANTFFGTQAGQSNTTGNDNSFFGSGAGRFNTTGNTNAFFGAGVGRNNTIGNGNAFFGAGAGIRNTTGTSNAFTGRSSGQGNTTGNNNTFVGHSAGGGNSIGSGNSFYGVGSGGFNTTGGSITIVGSFADVLSDNLTNATAIGSSAAVNQSNSLVLGSINGVNSALADTNVGIGTTAPAARLHVRDAGVDIMIGQACNSNTGAISFAGTVGGCADYALRGDNVNTVINRNAGGFISFRENNTEQVRINIGGTLRINTLGAAGATSLCRNASNEVSSCSSSARYKTNISTFSYGLDLVRKLRPVSFNWKDGGIADMGLVAEEVNAAEPLLTTTNEKGEVEGVKYDRVAVVLVNAVKEQQIQIDALQKQVNEQKSQLEKRDAQIRELIPLVCHKNKTAPICHKQ